MVDSWADLEEVDFEESDDNEALDEMARKKEEIDKIFLDAWNTKEGRRMIEYLKERYVDVPTARLGDTVQETFYRQGKADLIRDILSVISQN